MGFLLYEGDLNDSSTEICFCSIVCTRHVIYCLTVGLFQNDASSDLQKHTVLREGCLSKPRCVPCSVISSSSPGVYEVVTEIYLLFDCSTFNPKGSPPPKKKRRSKYCSCTCLFCSCLNQCFCASHLFSVKFFFFYSPLWLS